MSGHTPGPWRWEFNKQANSVYLVGGKPRFDKTVMQFGRWGRNRSTPLFNSHITGDEFSIMERICDMPAWTKPFAGLEHHASWRMDVIHPDAVLMAAAPELLEALKNFVDGCSTSVDATAQARAAIAKAEGRAE